MCLGIECRSIVSSIIIARLRSWRLVRLLGKLGKSRRGLFNFQRTIGIFVSYSLSEKYALLFKKFSKFFQNLVSQVGQATWRNMFFLC
jgi:hypothetical protein